VIVGPAVGPRGIADRPFRPGALPCWWACRGWPQTPESSPHAGRFAVAGVSAASQSPPTFMPSDITGTQVYPGGRTKGDRSADACNSSAVRFRQRDPQPTDVASRQERTAAVVGASEEHQVTSARPNRTTGWPSRFSCWPRRIPSSNEGTLPAAGGPVGRFMFNHRSSITRAGRGAADRPP